MEDMVSAAEIRWRAFSLPEPVSDVIASTPDVTGMAFADLVAVERQIALLTKDLQSYREMLSILLDHVRELTDELIKQHGTVKSLRAQIAQLMGVDLLA